MAKKNFLGILGLIAPLFACSVEVEERTSKIKTLADLNAEGEIYVDTDLKDGMVTNIHEHSISVRANLSDETLETHQITENQVRVNVNHYDSADNVIANNTDSTQAYVGKISLQAGVNKIEIVIVFLKDGEKITYLTENYLVTYDIAAPDVLFDPTIKQDNVADVTSLDITLTVTDSSEVSCSLPQLMDSTGALVAEIEWQGDPSIEGETSTFVANTYEVSGQDLSGYSLEIGCQDLAGNETADTFALSEPDVDYEISLTPPKANSPFNVEDDGAYYFASDVFTVSFSLVSASGEAMSERFLADEYGRLKVYASTSAPSSSQELLGDGFAFFAGDFGDEVSVEIPAEFVEGAKDIYITVTRSAADGSSESVFKVFGMPIYIDRTGISFESTDSEVDLSGSSSKEINLSFAGEGAPLIEETVSLKYSADDSEWIAIEYSDLDINLISKSLSLVGDFTGINASATSHKIKISASDASGNETNELILTLKP